MNNPLSMILDWLRVGYPDGVPPKDFYPLLALLTHNLSEEELEKIVGELKRENPEGEVSQEDVRGAIGRVTSAPVTEDHEREVAERLADAGWPVDEESAEVARALAADGGVDGADDGRIEGAAEQSASDAQVQSSAPSPAQSSAAPAQPQPSAGPGRTHAAASSNSVQRIIDWLSAGYPAGIPATDRLPLLALLRRQLTDDEAKEIASHLVDEAGHRIVDPTDAGVAITHYTNDLPTEQEMRRVAEHLAEQGWPLGERR
ncbi:DUF3349 domain-containing protein [Brachybacterium halotolerans subsp. kimchii]|uniref:DUF3349 domain-containing protein n=1 Tax=Brachybacterium halotolerans TaxID=2795215 RepID=UPI001E546629|nr:DUF3349 domain-containing protein [Brachybacterium halotolerans]UEJ83906.1 DUF3349 domain-containing protein [Brachybacterium halotolerans subsp. kimchii]